jgi:hypothetical protein
LASFASGSPGGHPAIRLPIIANTKQKDADTLSTIHHP